MNDNANGSTVERKRERIGLSLAPDVMDVLNKYGRSDLPCRGCEATPQPAICPRCGRVPSDKRPTRTEIIEGAVRMWGALKAGAEVEGSEFQTAHPERFNQSNNGTVERSAAPPDDNASSFNNPVTAEKKAARTTRKAALGDSVKAALPPRGVTVDSITVHPPETPPAHFRGSFPKPGKAK